MRKDCCPFVELESHPIAPDWYCTKCGAWHLDLCEIYPTGFMFGFHHELDEREENAI